MPVGLASDGRFGRFDLRGLLGRGGAGEVHLAFDPERGSLVALKLIRIGLDPEMLEAEKKGVSLQQRLQPKVPQIAAIYSYEEIEDFFCIVMEYVDGIDLSDVVKQGPLTPQRAVGIAIQLCTILESIELASKDLEERGRRVIHSDIKPANLRLQEGDRVRILDFGVAKSLAYSKKFTRHVFGSTPYLAPERLANEVVDAHTDLWAVSVVLYEMLAGYVPFPGDTTGAMERRIRNGGPPEPLPAGCPADLKSILFKCLRTDPVLRFPDAAALRRHLEAFRDGRPLRLSEPTHKVSKNLPEVEPTPAPQQPKVRRSERRRRRAGLRRTAKWVAFAAFLVFVAACHAYAWSEGKAIERALAEPGADLSALYDRYHNARWFDPSGLCRSGAAQALKSAFVAAADRTLEGFRSGARVGREEWDAALRWLRAAADLAESDEIVQAKLAFCEGELTRLDAEALFHTRPGEAKQKWQEALQSFEKARTNAPELVEVYLALASMYGDARTGLQDPKKLKEVLEETERRGAGQDERNKLALLEVRANEATQTLERSSRAQGKERIDLLYEARDDFEKVTRMCQDLKRRPPQACRKARERQEEISRKLGELNQV